MTNNFLVFDENNNNILTDAQYKVDTDRINGMTQGISRSIVFNKILRQASIMSSAFGSVLDSRGYDASDASLSSLTSSIDEAFPVSRGIPVGTLIEVTGNTTTVPVGTLRPDGTPFDPSKYKELANAYRISDDTYMYGQTFIGGVWCPNTPNKTTDVTTNLDYSKTISFNSFNTTWTVPSDGQIFISGNHYLHCVINGIDFYIGGGEDSDEVSSSSFHVSAGDTVRIPPTWGVRIQQQFFTPVKIGSGKDKKYLIIAYSGFNLPDMSRIGPTYKEVFITLNASGWDANLRQTLSVDGVTSDTPLDLGLPVPTTRDNADLAGASNIIIESIGIDEVTLSCAKLPKQELTMLIKIWSN